MRINQNALRRHDELDGVSVLHARGTARVQFHATPAQHVEQRIVDAAGARAHFERAVAADPRYAEANNNLAAMLRPA